MIEFRDISKRFGQAQVLRQVNFQLKAGRTLGLVGENGAGKSTLMNILGGNLTPDSGDLLLDGQAYVPRNPKDSARHGVAFIHQELNLFPNLSIAENLFLTDFPRWGRLPVIHRQNLRWRTADLLVQVGLPQSPDILVERLSAGEQQLVEIAKALSLEAKLIIFDEPTTSLSSRETDALFALIHKLKRQGISMIYISHTLGDVLRLCDDVVVLRDGEVVGSGTAAEFASDRMISLMVGRNLNQLYPQRMEPQEATILFRARQLSQPGIIHNISFDLHEGEVMGVFGLMGAGRTELARILFGLDRCEQGAIELRGHDLTRHSSRQRIRKGLAFLTENRHEDGLCLEASIADNIALVSLPKQTATPFKWLKREVVRTAVNSIREAVRLTASAKNTQSVHTLSGGNQQKVVLAKWLLAEPAVLILDEPTRGIDVGAKSEVYQLIQQLAAKGAGILVISSELEELTGLCDRILVMSHGEIRDVLSRQEFDRERILRSALHESVAS